jgi:hypothetical protein
MTLQPAAVLVTGILAVIASINVPRAGIGDREGAPFILPQGGAISSKAGPLVATAYICANLYKGTKFVGTFGYYAGNYAGPIYVPRGYSIATCPPSGSTPSFAISGYEGT